VVDRLSEPDKYFGANNEYQSTSYVSLSQQQHYATRSSISGGIVRGESRKKAWKAWKEAWKQGSMEDLTILSGFRFPMFSGCLVLPSIPRSSTQG
jgi:hypothetical protein